MDYEKKYKEMKARVLEMGRGYVKGLDYSKPRQIAEYIDPELKESEDEEIRCYLINFVKINDGINLPPDYAKKALAWLEKQGNNINCIYDKELSELLHVVICRYVNDPDISYIERENVSKKIFPYVELLEKQGEQKSADTDNKFIRMRETKPKDISEFLDRLTTVEQEFLWEHIAKIRELDKEEQSEQKSTMDEQKPAWSEEDEKMLDLIIAIFEVNYPNGYFKANELNDPDMKVVYTKEIVTWLKSLKERYTWKPSDEQILAIETAINVIGKGTLNGKQLVELQEQLKKLREK